MKDGCQNFIWLYITKGMLPNSAVITHATSKLPNLVLWYSLPSFLSHQMWFLLFKSKWTFNNWDGILHRIIISIFTLSNEPLLLLYSFYYIPMNPKKKRKEKKIQNLEAFYYHKDVKDIYIYIFVGIISCVK